MAEDQDWFGEDTATFGDRLAGAREAAGLTQTGLAEKMGVKLSVLRAWEDDLKEPRANRLQMVSGVLGVSMRWLLTGEGEGPEAPDADAALSEGLLDLLTEMRVLRGEIAQSGEKLARLEKRLRANLKDGG